MNKDDKHAAFWKIPEQHQHNKELKAIWELIVDFCEKYNLLEIPYYLYSESMLNDLQIARECLKTMQADGIVTADTKHGDRNKRKHPASVTYFKAINSMKKSLKALIKNAAKNSDGTEDIENDPLYKFFEKWS